MPKDCVTCLYLDIDMLVLGDLRQLFTLDLEQNALCVVKDRLNRTKKLRPKGKNLKDIYFTGVYFNAGFLVLNLPVWERESLMERCFEVMANYHLGAHDQDTLNAVIEDSKRLYLPFCFNLLVGAYICAVCKDEALRYRFDFARKEMNIALKNPQILHFAGASKPWHDSHIADHKGQMLSDLWWDIALQTPEFRDILQSEFKALRTNPHRIFASKNAIYLLNHTRNFWGFFTLPFVAVKIFGKGEVLESKSFKDSTKLIPSEHNFAFEIFALANKAWQRRQKGYLLMLPFRAIKLKFRHNHYGINRVCKL